MAKSCPICSSAETYLIFSDNEKNPKSKVFCCEVCDVNFLEFWDDDKFVRQLYSDDKYVFQHNISDDSGLPLKFNEYQKRYEWVKPYLDKGKSLLEVGCGDGTFLKMVRDELALAEGMELSQPQVTKLRSEGLTCYENMIGEMEAPHQYDIICMFAVLEHIPAVGLFLEELKNYMHSGTQVFIEVPNLNDALVSGYHLPEFKSFYFRPVHLYYFTPKSIGLLLAKHGYDIELRTVQQASITNHFHWMYERCGQPNGNYMASPIAPVSLDNKFPMLQILDQLDDYYRSLLESNNMGDLLDVRAWLGSKDD